MEVSLQYSLQLLYSGDRWVHLGVTAESILFKDRGKPCALSCTVVVFVPSVTWFADPSRLDHFIAVKTFLRTLKAYEDLGSKLIAGLYGHECRNSS